MNRYEEALRKRFGATNKRYLHSLRVAKTAYELAKRYGVSEDDAFIAGLLHDWEKNKSVAEVVTAARIEGLSSTQPAPVLHGPLAAITLQKAFPELNDAILSAIAKHTTGARYMSNLDKVVFVADAIEFGRANNERLNYLRELAKTASLDDLFLETFIISLEYVLEKHQQLSLESIALYNELIG